jgi:outer membrane protein OmpA-like peptidoglycan-associated protein
MFNRPAALLFVCGGLITNTALSQTRPNPTQERGTVSQGEIPIFRVTVVGRTTPAINYRPRRGDTKVGFAGTALMPQARGSASVSGEKGYIKVDARFSKLQPASRFGPEYLTYVLWAITPEGRSTNLGELQVDNDEDVKVEVTTQLQAFGLIVTAEPYFAVTQPSDVVVLENVVREGTNGSVEAVQAKYELLTRGAYLMNKDGAALKIKRLEPGAPLDLAEARNAVELARLAGADHYASDTFTKAATLLADAELARKRRRGGNAIMMPARQAAQTAEDARLIALQKQEDEFVAGRRAVALERERAALDQARFEQERRQQAERDALAAAAARTTAERDALTAAAAKTTAERDALAAIAAKTTAERERADAEAARIAAETARNSADAARSAADAARLTAEAQTKQAQDVAAQSEHEKDELRARLREQLNVILETRETARGLIVSLSDVLFDTGSANLTPGAREKLARVSGVLLAQPELAMEVDGHTDSVGSDSYNQRLSEQRAASVRDYFVRQGIAPTAVATSGFGKSQPVASNDTAAGRQQNRRVELVVTGAAIGRR